MLIFKKIKIIIVLSVQREIYNSQKIKIYYLNFIKKNLLNELKIYHFVFLKLTKIINCKKAILFHLFKKLLFTMENATAADSSQSNISRIYI